MEWRQAQPLIGSHCLAIHWQQGEDGFVVVNAYAVDDERGEEYAQYFRVFRFEQELVEYLADEFGVMKLRTTEEQKEAWRADQG